MKVEEITRKDIELLLNVIPNEFRFSGLDILCCGDNIKVWNNDAEVAIEFRLNQYYYSVSENYCNRDTYGMDVSWDKEIIFETFVKNLHRKIEELENN